MRRMPILFLALVSLTACDKIKGMMGKGGADAGSSEPTADTTASASASAAPADPSATVAVVDSNTPAQKAAPAKKVLPTCGAGTMLVAAGEGSAPYCAKGCSKDDECKPGKCDQQGFSVDAKTGQVFTGVGKSVPVCSGGTTTAAADAGAAPLTVPPGNPFSFPNPNSLPCPAGYKQPTGTLKTCNKTCDEHNKCPAPSKCSPLHVCTT